MAPPNPIYPASELFDALREDEIRRLLDLGRVLVFPPHTSLYRQGERARQLFLLESGLVRLSQVAEQGEKVVVRFIRPGWVFGYFSLTGSANPTSAQVVQPSRLAVWEGADALQALLALPQAAVNLFNLAAHDVLYFQEHIRRLRTQTAPDRIKWALSELLRTAGVPTEQGPVITGFAQKEIAELAGTTVFSVSRELTILQNAGVLRKQRGRIVVLQPGHLDV